MPYGPVNLSEFQTSDGVAPGAPTFVNVSQLDNNLIRATVALPTTDSNGDNLSGLAKLTVATAPKPGATNPFEGLSMDQILALPGVVKSHVSLTEADAGTQKNVDLSVVNLGGFQALAAAVSDD